MREESVKREGEEETEARRGGDRLQVGCMRVALALVPLPPESHNPESNVFTFKKDSCDPIGDMSPLVAPLACIKCVDAARAAGRSGDSKQALQGEEWPVSSCVRWCRGCSLGEGLGWAKSRQSCCCGLLW